MACMLWEGTFYESGEEIADRIAKTIPKVKPVELQAIAVEARNEMKLRHVPLLIAREMARDSKFSKYVRGTLKEVIQRPDELTEFLSIYWKDGREPVSKQARLGLADAFGKFNEYSLAKYNRPDKVKLRDVLRIVHPVPANKAQAKLWKKVIDGTLEVPYTWETELSAAGPEADKKEIWTRLLKDEALGALALLRNLRNMTQAKVNVALIREALLAMKPDRVLPFRFITAARHAPQFEPELEKAMFKCLENKDITLDGTTTVLVDVSGSMNGRITQKSEVMGMDAAAGLAVLLREVCEDIKIATFSNDIVEVPPRRGFALRDAIVKSQPHGGTYLGRAVYWANVYWANDGPSDRLIVLTDEQSHDVVPNPVAKDAYMINVSSNRNGVGYGPWTHIDGWSEAIVDYIAMYERH